MLDFFFFFSKGQVINILNFTKAYLYLHLHKIPNSAFCVTTAENNVQMDGDQNSASVLVF